MNKTNASFSAVPAHVSGISHRLGRGGLAAMLVVVIAGCAMGPDYQRPSVELPSAYTAFPGTAASQPSAESPASRLNADWWTRFNDPALNQLIQDALARNVDLRAAAAQIEETDALLRQTNAAYFPELDLAAAASRSRVSTATALPNVAPLVRDERRGALSTSFELDFWGKLRRGSESARAQALASEYGRDVVALTIGSTTAQAYFTLRSLDSQARALANVVAARKDSVVIFQARLDAGSISEVEFQQASAAYAESQGQLTDTVRQRALIEHQLGALTGRVGRRIPESDANARLPVAPPVPVGLPSTLLERRPDVRAAEQNLVAANAQIGVAKAALFPSISLTGSFGGQSSALSTLLDSGARIWSGGVGLALPIFDAGKNLARLDQTEARQKLALANYQKAIETAFRETADALSNVGFAKRASHEGEARFAAAQRALALVRERYALGATGYIEVLEAQRSANDAQIALIRNWQSEVTYTVDLMKSIGGGWGSLEAAKP
jgi:multidrug efflux system outer membrane protein